MRFEPSTSFARCRRAAPWAAGLLAIGAVLAMVRLGAACPFCSAVSKTLSEEMRDADATIIAKLVKAPPTTEPGKEPAGVPAETQKADFRILEVLKGPKSLAAEQVVTILYFGQEPVGQEFVIAGTDPKQLLWGTPVPLSPRARQYVARLPKLPESGRDRLAFFQDFLEDSDALLAADSYDEFAKTPYSEVLAIKDLMPHDKLVSWIGNPDTATSRRRLYLTMLGICGSKGDVPTLEKMIKSDDRQMRSALDALVACYLTLTGPDGLTLIEDLFLKNKKAEYTDTYSAIMALRFLGQETTVIEKPRLTAALRTMLDRPQLADLVIPDLARWQDWTVMGKLVELFKTANEESIWVRVPVVNYLRACPLPEAKAQIEELKKIDPEAVKRANQFFPIGAATPPAGSQRPAKGADVPPPTPKTEAKPTANAGASLP